MFYTKNLDQIQIVESELLININFVNQKRIPLNEIKKVFVSVKKIPLQYEIFYIIIGGIFIGLNFSFYQLAFISGWYLGSIYLGNM